MAVDNFDSPYAIVINTDKYTGGFERELCAYVTGAVGECEVGEEMADIFVEEEGEDNYLPDITDHVPDDNGCRRPVSIYDDGDHYNSLVIFLNSMPSDEEWDLIVRRTKQFCATRPDWRDCDGPTIIPIGLTGMRVIANKVVRTQITVTSETF